jgi:hypothetical protein
MESSNKSRNMKKNKVIFTAKKEVSNINDGIETTFLDEMMLRFPHIVRDVFKELDNKSLTNCRNMSRACCDFIDNEKLYWVRKIQNYVTMKNFLQQWQKVLRNTPTENIKEIFVTIKQFVDNDLNRKKKQYSPLYIAAAQGHLEFWKCAMERTNYTNSKTKDGITAFHMAALSGCREICEQIIDHLEDKNPADKKGMTPFHNASEKGHFDVCKIIIQNIDNKNPAALDGCTPLHLATKHGHLEIVRMIVTAEVDKSPRFKGKTPLDLVRPRSRYRFYPLLINNILQFWYCFFGDVAITFFSFLFNCFMLSAIWMLILVVVCAVIGPGEVKNCPELFVMSYTYVPGTIALLFVAISWVYLSGCIHKYITNHDFWFENYLEYLYK